MKDKSIFEELPLRGTPIALRIESFIYQASPDGQDYGGGGAVTYEDDYPDEPPFDYEEAALRYLEDSEKSEGDMPQRMVQNTEAIYTECDGRVTVSYDDSEMLGLEGTLTQITYRTEEPGSVAIIRSGPSDSMFVLEEGKRHICEYRMGGLSFPVSFYARQVKNTVCDGAGEIYLDYSIEMSGACTQITKMKITLRNDGLA